MSEAELLSRIGDLQNRVVQLEEWRSRHLYASEGATDLSSPHPTQRVRELYFGVDGRAQVGPHGVMFPKADSVWPQEMVAQQVGLPPPVPEWDPDGDGTVEAEEAVEWNGRVEYHHGMWWLPAPPQSFPLFEPVSGRMSGFAAYVPDAVLTSYVELAAAAKVFGEPEDVGGWRLVASSGPSGPKSSLHFFARSEMTFTAPVMFIDGAWGWPPPTDVEVDGSGEIDVTGIGFALVSDPGANDLSVINGGAFGQLLMLRAASSAVNVVHGAGIKLVGGANLSLTSTTFLTLIEQGGVWWELYRAVHT